MSSRKLQTELDKLVKKVAEGIELFESFYEKVQSATNPTIKEKNETELKKEIKKLQRHRDVIKGYIGGNEVKDKKVLIDNRKAIETCMEKFKAIEKELKRKAFSKEGLDAAAKMDPLELERMNLTEWLSNTVNELGTQIDALEAEQESLQTTMKKGKKDKVKDGQMEKVLHHMERHKYHVTKLEIILRMFENESLPIEQIRDLQDNVNYYVESNKDPDFTEDEFIYDDLDLDDAETFGFNNEEDGEGHGSVSLDEDTHHHTSSSSKESVAVKDEVSPASSTTAAVPNASRKKGSAGPKESEPEKKIKAATAKSGLPPPPTTTTKATTSKLPAAKPFGTGAPVPVAPIPAIKYAQAAAAHVADKIASPASSLLTSPSDESSTPLSRRDSTASIQSTTPAGSTIPMASTPLPFAQIAKALEPKPQPTTAPPPTVAAVAYASKVTHPSAAVPPQQGSPAGSPATVAQSNMTNPLAPPLKFEPIDNRIPPALSDLVLAFEASKQRAMKNETFDPQSVAMLEQSFKYVPECVDAERPKLYFPRNPAPMPGYYPQTPLALYDGSVGSRSAYEKLDLDTLFFIFYYQQGTLQQLLAARELKRQSWRFHKKYLTWFQRHEEPKHITEDFEQGTYIYFDYEGAWCQRRKADFRFEYQYLEDDSGIPALRHSSLTAV